MTDGNGYLLFVWSPAGYTLREEQGDPPQPRRRVRGRRPDARDQQDRCVAASRATRALRLLGRQVSELPSRFRRATWFRLRRQPGSQRARRLQRRRGRARAPARGRSRSHPSATPPASTPAAHRPSSAEPSSRSTRARSSMRMPPIVCVIEATTRTAATVPAGAIERQVAQRRRARHAAPPRPSRHGAVAHAPLERRGVEQVVRLRAGAARGRLHDVRLRPRNVTGRRRTRLPSSSKIRAKRPYSCDSDTSSVSPHAASGMLRP